MCVCVCVCISICIYIYIYTWIINQVDKVLTIAPGPGVQSQVESCQRLKMILITPCLTFKGKMEQSREMSSALL